MTGVQTCALPICLGSYETRQQIKTKLRDVIPRWPDIRASAWPTVRGTALGAALGVLPGTGPFIASYSAYALESRIAKDPSRFGKGAVEGVAAPEAANNASAFTHYIPMLSLGVPAGAVFAMLMGALMMHYMLETIFAAALLRVDPYDQPAVEEGKVLARKYLARMG